MTSIPYTRPQQPFLVQGVQNDLGWLGPWTSNTEIPEGKGLGVVLAFMQAG